MSEKAQRELRRETKRSLGKHLQEWQAVQAERLRLCEQGMKDAQFRLNAQSEDLAGHRAHIATLFSQVDEQMVNAATALSGLRVDHAKRIDDLDTRMQIALNGITTAIDVRGDAIETTVRTLRSETADRLGWLWVLLLSTMAVALIALAIAITVLV